MLAVSFFLTFITLLFVLKNSLVVVAQYYDDDYKKDNRHTFIYKDIPDKQYLKKARFVWFLMRTQPRARIDINNLPKFRRPTDQGDYFYVFLNYMLQDCHIDALNIKDFQKASDNNNHAVVRHYLEPGTTFLIPVWDRDPVSGLTQTLLDIFHKYNVSSQDYTLIHTADETHEYRHPKLIEFYRTWKKVYRHNWWNTSDFYKLRTENKLEWYPLHHLKMTNLTSADMIPASKRSLNMTFRGNDATNSRRRPQVKELQKFLGTKLGGKVFKSGAFSADASKSKYLTEMLDSRLCLNIRGRTPECHRFYESLEFGCIPVFIDRYPTFDYTYQFRSWKSKIMEVKWRKGHELPFIWVKDFAEMKVVYERLLNTGEEGLRELDQMQRDCMEWWGAAKLFLKSRFEEAVCTLPG